MTRALITGSTEQVTAVAVALRSAGFNPVCADGWNTLADVCATMPAQSFGCYVQLPARHPARMTTSLGHLRAAIADGPLARVDVVAALAPLLAKEATVLLVLGDAPGETVAGGAELLRRAVGDLVRVLADAILEDHGASGVRVTVVGAHRSAEDIAELACRQGNLSPPWTSYADHEPDASFSGWRLEVLGLASEHD
jgi:hypothetical protein